MGDPAQYPEIRTARFLYAMQWLPPDLRADYGARQQWIDNNMSYLDGLAPQWVHVSLEGLSVSPSGFFLIFFPDAAMLRSTKMSGDGGWESFIAGQSLCLRFYDDFVFTEFFSWTSFGDTKD
eukprot:scaffold42526_cov298-Isochrysis_galbana.AAC.1